MTRTTSIALFMATVIGVGTMQLTTPAIAGGGITMMLTPQGDTARMIQQGLQIYGMVQQHKSNKKNNAKVSQKGRNNAAALSQKGGGNYGLLHQRGSGHTATVAQEGRNNAFGAFQFGRNTNLDMVQTGNSQLNLIFQGGW
jgi:hypothetical protein